MDLLDGPFLPRVLEPLPELTLLGLAIVAVTVMAFAPGILKRCNLNSDSTEKLAFRVNVLRGFSAIALLIAGALHPGSPIDAQTPGFVRFLWMATALYLYYILFFATAHVLRQRFGRVHSSHRSTMIVDTYRSRGFTITARLILTLVLLIVMAHGLEADDLLRTSGLVAAFLVLLGLSQSAWAPDYISGLVILYSEMFKEGDTVKLADADRALIGEIYRIKAFHTEILSFVDNHRVMVRNSRMREYTIHNLSKYASAKGLRERMSFKIGYDTPEKQVKAMFKAAFATIARDRSIAIERDHLPEVRVHDTGDHAVEWSVYYFTKDSRKVLLTRQKVIEVILATSKRFNVSLATPLTHHVELGNATISTGPGRDVGPTGRDDMFFGAGFGSPLTSR